MLIESSKRGSYHLLQINDDLNLYSNVSILKDLVQKSIAAGEKNIALRFSSDSYFSSQTVAVLVYCIEVIKECGGQIAFIAPNHNLLHLMAVIDIDSFIQIAQSEADIVALVAVPTV
jgi:anti-anti-sigma factor